MSVDDDPVVSSPVLELSLDEPVVESDSVVSPPDSVDPPDDSLDVMESSPTAVAVADIGPAELGSASPPSPGIQVPPSVEPAVTGKLRPEGQVGSG